jgi:hypothetical protein
MNFPCPKCGFQGSAIQVNGSRQCLGCAHVWFGKVVYPEAPPRVGPVATEPSGRNLGIIVGVVIALVFIAAVVWMISDAIDAPVQTYDPAAEFSSAPAAALPIGGTLEAELGAPASGESWGSPWWLVEYRNTGTGVIGFPTVLAYLSDADGKPLDTLENTSNVYSLPPNDSAWIFVNPVVHGATARIEIKPPEGIHEWSPITRRLQLSNFLVEDNPDVKDYSFLSGTLRNTNGLSVGSVLVQAVGFDAADKPCAYTLGYAEGSSVAVNATTTFRFGSGTWQTSKPARWEIHAWGTLQK